MDTSAQYLSASDAARQLGVSIKALRLYEQRGLLTPTRTATGWRTYGPDAIAKGHEIVSLRSIGLSLSGVAQVIGGDAGSYSAALAAHQKSLGEQIAQLSSAVERVEALRANLAKGTKPTALDLAGALLPETSSVSFDLPWPWAGERFSLPRMRPLNYVVGPLGSGKTKLVERLAEALPDCIFLGPDRATGIEEERLGVDAELKARVDDALAWLVEDGAELSGALTRLLVAIEEVGGPVIVDMVEQHLNHQTQEALAAYLRRRSPFAKPLFLLTRSSAILDLAAMRPNDLIIYCPANHSPPMLVSAYPGSPGYDSVSTCLATPEVRARTEGVVAWRPEVT